MIDRLFIHFLLFYYFENGNIDKLTEILNDSEENIFSEMTEAVERAVQSINSI